MRCILISFLLACCFLNAQDMAVLQNSHSPQATASYNPALKPFYHGVASGDPLQNQVVIWTRVTPDSAQVESTLSGNWYLASDTAMSNIIQQGSFTTDSTKDFTVKVDVKNLDPGSTYYYMFSSSGVNSLRGRTKTLPAGSPDRLKFAVVSCNNYEGGYFTAFGHLAQRNDIDAVLHLGDYIYEYKAGTFGDSSIMRFHQQFETVSKDQYRTRYSLYRLDPDLRAAHQQHVFINIWDDHESANDSWEHGAQNHDPATEGPWSLRKSASSEAFFEWLPIREQAQQKIYRSFQFGDLVDLIMLDTRLEGRDKQLSSITDTSLNDTARTMLGAGQRNWLLNELSTSTGRWRVFGNQVIFAQMQLGWAGPAIGMSSNKVESMFLDIWDGYPAERQRVITHLDTADIDNSIFITGDFHCSFAFDIADTVVDEANNYAAVSNYNPLTGSGSVAVEFVTPSISSANFDERFNAFAASIMEQQINSTLGPPINNNPNPHMKFVDLDRHGYIILDVRADSVKANWYYTGITSASGAENFARALQVKDGQNHLQPARKSTPKLQQDIPAPEHPLKPGVSLKEERLSVFSVYPNPAGSSLNLQLGLAGNESKISLSLRDMAGRLVLTYPDMHLRQGVSDLRLDTSPLDSGAYFLEIICEGETRILKLQIH